MPDTVRKRSANDVRDIAAVAVRTLTDPGHEGKTHVITGSEALTFTDVAALFDLKTISY